MNFSSIRSNHSTFPLIGWYRKTGRNGRKVLAMIAEMTPRTSATKGLRNMTVNMKGYYHAP